MSKLLRKILHSKFAAHPVLGFLLKIFFSVRTLNYLGLAFFFVLVVFYLLLGPWFAEFHVTSPGRYFPIFIGEIVLGICFGLWVVRRSVEPRAGFKPRDWILLLYGSWVVIKAIGGFFENGAYGLRNAALFYYPLVALLTYDFSQVFWKKMLFQKKGWFGKYQVWGILVITGVATAGLLNSQGTLYGRYYLYVILVSIFLAARPTPLKWLSIGLISVAGWKMGYFDYFSRAHFLGFLAAVLFLGFYYYFIFNVAVRTKLIMVSSLVVVFVTFIWLRMDSNALRSIFEFDELKAMYTTSQETIKQKRATFVFEELSVRIYKDEYEGPILYSARRTAKNLFAKHVLKTYDGPDGSYNVSGDPLNELSNAAEAQPEENTDDKIKSILRSREEKQLRPLTTACVNIFFRYYIWRDMVVELIQKRPGVFGFGFGYQQRSRSLEILNWGTEEWQYVGWVTPHNSFLHYIYRGGLVGLGIILAIFYFLGRAIHGCARHRRFIGGLLLSPLIYAVMALNFLVFLELPYTAIPFWFLFGLMLGYVKILDTKAKPSSGIKKIS